MKCFLISALAAILISPSLFAGDAATSFQVSIADKDHRLFLSADSTNIADLTPFCHCAFVDEAKVLAQHKKRQNYYLVVSMSGLSKAQADSHYCGAGSEANVVWLKLDKQFKLMSSSNYLVDSCFKSIEISQELEYVDGGRKMQGGFASYSEMEEYQLSYDTAEPEKGIVITSKPLD